MILVTKPFFAMWGSIVVSTIFSVSDEPFWGFIWGVFALFWAWFDGKIDVRVTTKEDEHN